MPSDRAGHSGIKPSTSDDRQQPIEMPDLSRYEMNKSPHGIAVIFNQEYVISKSRFIGLILYIRSYVM